MAPVGPSKEVGVCGHEKEKKHKGKSVLQKVFIIILIIFSTFTSSTGRRFILQDNWQKLFSQKSEEQKWAKPFQMILSWRCIYILYILYMWHMYENNDESCWVPQLHLPSHTLTCCYHRWRQLSDFFPSVQTPSPKPRSSLKKCRQNDFTHRFGFPWRWTEKQKIFEGLHLLFFVKISSDDNWKRIFVAIIHCSFGWAKCTHKGNCTGNPSRWSQGSANGRPWHKKIMIIRHEKRSERTAWTRVAGEKIPF